MPPYFFLDFIIFFFKDAGNVFCLAVSFFAGRPTFDP